MGSDARLERVMAEMAWVRRLARSLARDDADDVAQEAWLVASVRAPDDSEPLRPWLARVVHNLVRMRGRSGGRRRAREAIAPVPADEATPHELLERVQAQRAIADEVLALAEPYRSAILLFYVEGVSTGAIARRLQVPASTVRRRLKVGRDQLRARMRDAGLFALIAIAATRHADAAPALKTIGALTMKKLLVALAILALLLGIGSVVVPHRHATITASSAPVAPTKRTTSIVPFAHGAHHTAGDLVGTCTSRLVGIVRDATGNPIGGARLTSAGLAGVDAAADGSFALCLGRNTAWVRVAAEGYGAVGFFVAIGGELHHDIVLVPEAVMTGDVVDEAGKPVANARIFAVVDSNGTGAADGSAFSDANGAFRVTQLAPGRYRVSATTDSGLGARVPVMAIANSAPIHLILAQRARISGRVVDGSGLAIAGARISVDDRFDATAFAISQLDGSFTLIGVPLGPIALIAAPYEVRTPRRIVVDKLVMEDVKLEVGAARSLRGVVTRNGAAVAGASVTCDGDPVTTDATGNYVLTGIGLQCNLRATADRATSVAQTIALAASETRIVDIDLASSASITGTVVDVAGIAVPAVEVVARRPEHPSDLCTTMTGSAGDFDCTGLAGAADYEIDVYPGPGTRKFSPANGERLVHVDGGDAIAHVTLAIAHDRKTIHGIVVDDTGAPIADALVTSNVGDITYGAPTPSSRTDEAGAFTLDNLGAGAYRVSAKVADGGSTTQLGVVAGTTDLVLHVARAGAIAGDLVGFATPPSLTTHESSAGGDTSGFPIVDGPLFSLSGLSPGTYRIEAWDDAANVEADAATVVVRAGTTSRVTLRERGRGMVSAHVIDSVTRAPIAGLACHVAAVSEGNIGCCHWLFDTPPTLSDLQGQLAMSAPAGAARVFCMPSLQPPFPPDAPYSWASADVQVPANGTGYAEVIAVPRNYPRSDVGFYLANFVEPAQVIQVEPGSAAAASGLAIGDTITAIDGTATAGLAPNAILTLATNHRPGTLLGVGTPRGTFTFVVGAAALP